MQRASKETQPDTAKNQNHRIRSSFFCAVNSRIQSNRLGDLLVLSKLITVEQLEKALGIQKATGEALGKVLLRERALSPVQLYRKLAEQWCIKASTAGLTLMLGIMTLAPTGQARAQSSEFQVAAAEITVPRAVKPHQPTLFGTAEFRSDNISAFTKWTGMFVRLEKQLDAEGDSSTITMWKERLNGLKEKAASEQIEHVNRFVNEVRYVPDKKIWGKSDHWATPVEFFGKGSGDCEDYAIAKYISLRALGFTNDQMRLVIVQDLIKDIPHAVLVVYTDRGAYVLDNQEKSVRLVNEVTRYRPIFSINRSSWWLHKSDLT